MHVQSIDIVKLHFLAGNSELSGCPAVLKAVKALGKVMMVVGNERLNLLNDKNPDLAEFPV